MIPLPCTWLSRTTACRFLKGRATSAKQIVTLAASQASRPWSLTLTVIANSVSWYCPTSTKPAVPLGTPARFFNTFRDDGFLGPCGRPGTMFRTRAVLSTLLFYRGVRTFWGAYWLGMFLCRALRRPVLNARLCVSGHPSEQAKQKLDHVQTSSTKLTNDGSLRS